MKVSLIITTFNESKNIPALLDSVLTQARKPDEFVVVDGGSKDDTLAILKDYRERLEGAGIEVNLVEAPGANIARGRNTAIRAARNECIIATDAGCVLDSRWCERLCEPIEAGRANFVGGYFRAVSYDAFQAAVAALTTDVRTPQHFMPSSRSIAFTKDMWEKAGGYPEWLDWGEDTMFNTAMMECGAVYEPQGSGFVYWEVRKNYRSLIKQFYRYSMSDGLSAQKQRVYMALTLPYFISVLVFPFRKRLSVLPFVAMPLIWMIRRRAVSPATLVTTFPVALTIQMTRVIGNVVGLVRRTLNTRGARR